MCDRFSAAFNPVGLESVDPARVAHIVCLSVPNAITHVEVVLTMEWVN